MKKISLLIISLVLLCCCQTKQSIIYPQNKQINFGNGISIVVKEASIVPTHLYTYNETIDAKLSSSKRLHNTTYNDEYLFLEVILNVKNEGSESLFVQNELNFIIEENDVLYPGMLVEENWENGYLWIPHESKATLLKAKDSKIMRLYFWVPDEILDASLILKEDSSNTQITLDIAPITSTWIEIKQGDTIETDEYSMIIKDIMIQDSQIQNEYNFTFYGLNVEIIGKVNKQLSTDTIIRKIYAYHDDKSVNQADIYEVLNFADVLTDNDVDGFPYDISIKPNEKKEVTFGYIDYRNPKGFIFLRNKKIYYLPMDN